MEKEKRLIEYDAVYQYAFDGVHGGRLEDEDFSAIINAIDAVPIVDAVEVVRCKDCKYCEFCYPEKQIGKEPTPAWICKMHKAYRRPNDFCSFGERKEDG